MERLRHGFKRHLRLRNGALLLKVLAFDVLSPSDDRPNHSSQSLMPATSSRRSFLAKRSHDIFSRSRYCALLLDGDTLKEDRSACYGDAPPLVVLVYGFRAARIRRHIATR